MLPADADLPHQGIFGREDGRRSGAGNGEEIPDAALHTWGLDSRQNTKPGLILRADGQQSVRGQDASAVR
jgi:hypothetical protein